MIPLPKFPLFYAPCPPYQFSSLNILSYLSTPPPPHSSPLELLLSLLGVETLVPVNGLEVVPFLYGISFECAVLGLHEDVPGYIVGDTALPDTLEPVVGWVVRLG